MGQSDKFIIEKDMTDMKMKNATIVDEKAVKEKMADIHQDKKQRFNNQNAGNYLKNL